MQTFYNRAYGMIALPKLIDDITKNSIDNKEIALAAMSELNTWLLVPENACSAVNSKIAINLGYILVENDFRKCGILRAFITLSRNPIGRKHLIMSHTLSVIPKMFDEVDDLECKTLAYKLVEAMSFHPNGAESIIISGIVKTCFERLKIESVDIQEIILSIFENISAISPIELLKQPNCMSTFIDFINFDKFSRNITLLSSSIVMNLCSLEDGKKSALENKFIDVALKYIRESGYSSKNASAVAKRLLGGLTFVAVLVEAKKICMNLKCADICLEIIDMAGHNFDTGKCDEIDINLTIIALKAITLLAELPEGKKMFLESESKKSIVKLENCQYSDLEEAAKTCIEVIEWKP